MDKESPPNWLVGMCGPTNHQQQLASTDFIFSIGQPCMNGGTYQSEHCQNVKSLLVSIYYNYNIKKVMDPDLIQAAFWGLMEMDRLDN